MADERDDESELSGDGVDRLGENVRFANSQKIPVDRSDDAYGRILSDEGVRIVDKDEAQAALDSGAAISRQSQGRLVSLVGMESDENAPTWADTDEQTSVRIVGGSERVSSSLRMPESM